MRELRKNVMNILFCSVGRRAKLLQNFKTSLGENVKIVATDMSFYAPALYFADKSYIVPGIDDEQYLHRIIEICMAENINVITTLIDTEIEMLARNRKCFEDMGVLVLAPMEKTAQLCFDKYEMCQYLLSHNIKTVKTYATLDNFKIAYDRGEIKFPVFVKPRTGSGSVGAQKVGDMKSLENFTEENPCLLIQEYMDGTDIDADVYIDAFGAVPVSMFCKKKISTTIGGANKTISFKDERLFEFIKRVVSVFEFCGPIDMDFFYKDGEYYLSEINPRFGGAYLHAYGAGVDFTKLIEVNAKGKQNEIQEPDYEDDVLMLMFDDVYVGKGTGECLNKEQE